MTFTYGPFDAGSGASLGENDYMDDLGPYLAGGDGIVGAPGSTALQVYGNSSGMQVFIRAGKAVIRGGKVKNDADVLITIGANGSGLPRTDRVVIRHDRTANTVTPHVIVGTPGAGPPAITQTVGGTWDVLSAQIIVAAGAVTITSGNVLDERTFLPLHIPYCNTTVAVPPADGSQGRVFYDLAINNVIVTDGGTWFPVLIGDTGWANLTLATGWSTAGYGPQYRRWGPLVEFRVDATAALFGSGPTVCTLPAGFRPGAPGRLFPCYADASASVGSPQPVQPTCSINAAGAVSLNGGSDASGSNIGWADVRFIVNATFLAG